MMLLLDQMRMSPMRRRNVSVVQAEVPFLAAAHVFVYGVACKLRPVNSPLVPTILLKQ